MLQTYTMKLYNNLGFCDLVAHYGEDRTITQAARISYGHFDHVRDMKDDRKLLEYLFVNRHTSPFEQPNITFHIKMPIFVMRQFVRHRTFKLNEYSARYKELPDQFYVPQPEQWRAKGGSSKQGSVEGNWIQTERDYMTHYMERVCQDAYQCYRELLSRGVAPEQARMVMPLNSMTEIVVQCDLHNLMHFLYLRTHPHAQKEIRDLAEAMLEYFSQLFPWTAELWHTHEPKMIDR